LRRFLTPRMNCKVCTPKAKLM
ncbi:L-Ala-D/L-Glu epimerase domain protein, partial [Vibrio parahaemolyticus V-223/04]